MAEPTDPAKLAVVAAQDKYNAAAAVLDDLLDNFPNLTWDSSRIDTWIMDAVSYWSTCEDNWSEAGVVSKEWYKLEYSLLVRVPDLSMDKVKFSHREFNELVERALDYNLDVVPLPVRRTLAKRSKTTASPSQPCHNAAATDSRAITPVPLLVPLKTTIPVPPPPKPAMPLPHKEKTPAPQKQQSVQLATAPQKKVMPTPITSQVVQPSFNALLCQAASTQPVDLPKTTPPPGSSGTFQKDWSSPLHHKPGQQFKIRPPKDTTHSEAPTQASSRAFAVDAAAHSNIVRGPDPNLDFLQEGNILVPSTNREPLFLPGTDDEEEQAQEDLVKAGRVDDEVAGTNGEDGDLRGQDEDDASSSDEATSPPPTNMARRLHQEPKISFVFDEATGDFIESHPTIFLPRPAVPTSQSQVPRRSARSHVSPVNSTTAYLKTAQSSKLSNKKKKRDAKGKDKASEVAIPCKHARNEDEASQTIDKPAAKKLKSKDRQIDEVAVRPTPVVRRCGPGLSKPPPVTLGVSGGGFGEKVPSTATAIRNSIKSIGVLKVDNDFGEFVEIDGSYWSKAIAPFVGDIPLPVTIVNGVVALNPIEHYRPKGSNAVNTFEAALNAIEANNAAIAEITQQYLADLSLFVHTDNIRAQASRLHGCLDSIEEGEDNNNDESEEDEAPDDVAEGESGPSKKRKHRSG
ncbi:hypothetical protein ARMGADRAFT_1092290 [Armillaria gallica]|uniref:Uncharacterized protein n=1 Tax=Armillaria gallica TaxID=47427 RepID=A0A2H3CW62_ARMGA|nr:hypothetical protein ARMGADRAFT_1092290 [Armillaria gallica]